MEVTMWGVKGKLDGIFLEGEEWKLLEIKTMNPKDFKRFKREGLTTLPRYYEQVMFYLAACGEIPFKEPIDKAVLLAENTFPLGELHAEELTIDYECVDQTPRK